jgi:hypothetical protein
MVVGGISGMSTKTLEQYVQERGGSKPIRKQGPHRQQQRHGGRDQDPFGPSGNGRTWNWETKRRSNSSPWRPPKTRRPTPTPLPMHVIPRGNNTNKYANFDIICKICTRIQGGRRRLAGMGTRFRKYPSYPKRASASYSLVQPRPS